MTTNASSSRHSLDQPSLPPPPTVVKMKGCQDITKKLLLRSYIFIKESLKGKVESLAKVCNFVTGSQDRGTNGYNFTLLGKRVTVLNTLFYFEPV